MGQEEKDIYATIFKLTLLLSKYKKFASFAKRMIDTSEIDINGEARPVLDKCWEILKEYADIKNVDEERWRDVVREVDEYGAGKDNFTRKALKHLIDELERRSINDNR